MPLLKTKSKEETQKIGEGIAQKIKAGGVVCLFGELGAGKTTLTQGIAKGLGVKQNIISPTFILMRRYETGDRFFYHVDLYRLNDSQEVRGLGIDEIVSNPENIVIVEWPEKIVDTLPRRATKIYLKSISEEEREIEIIS